MKVIVTGSRYWRRPFFIHKELDKIHKQTPITLLVHGCALGADTIADQWAANNRVPVLPYPAEWSVHGNAAGPIRNSKMLEENTDADLVIGFPIKTMKNVGTQDCLKKARVLGFNVIEIT